MKNGNGQLLTMPIYQGMILQSLDISPKDCGQIAKCTGLGYGETYYGLNALAVRGLVELVNGFWQHKID